MKQHKAMHPADGTERPQSPYNSERQERDITRSRMKTRVGVRAKWATTRITIVQTYDEHGAEE
jgi:hypothetical protein